jgi:hypothetical protein
MGHIDLHYDASRDLFTISVTLIVSDEDPPKLGPITMYVDTGSNKTFVAEDKALDMGLHLDGRATERVAGIAGVGGAPILTKVQLVLVDGAFIALDRVLVMLPPHQRDKVKKGPIFKTRETRVEGVSLFGLEAVRKLRGRLTFDLSGDPLGSLDW